MGMRIRYVDYDADDLERVIEETLSSPLPGRGRVRPTCRAEGCSMPVQARGLCGKHYYQVHRRGRDGQEKL